MTELILFMLAVIAAVIDAIFLWVIGAYVIEQLLKDRRNENG